MRCAGGNCTKQCLYCLTYERAEQEVSRRCFQCSLLVEICSCQRLRDRDNACTAKALDTPRHKQEDPYDGFLLSYPYAEFSD